MDSSGFDTSGSGPLSSGGGGADGTSRLLAEGSAFNTTGGLTTLNTALAMLGMKSGSEKIGVSDVVIFQGNPPRNEGPGLEATPQLLVPQPPSAQSVRLPHVWLWTRHI